VTFPRVAQGGMARRHESLQEAEVRFVHSDRDAWGPKALSRESESSQRRRSVHADGRTGELLGSVLPGAGSADAQEPERPDDEQARRDADVAPDELVPVRERVDRAFEPEVKQRERDVLRGGCSSCVSRSLGYGRAGSTARTVTSAKARQPR